TNLLTFFLYGGLGVIFFVMPFEMIEVGGFSAWQAGAAGLPFIAAVFSLSRLSGAVMDRYGPRLPLTLGPFTASAGMALFHCMAKSHASYLAGYLFPMLVLGIGMAITIAPLTTSVMGAAGDTYAGTASGINNTVARMAGLLGIASLAFVIPALFGVPFRVGVESYRAATALAALLAFTGGVCGGFARGKLASARSRS
ncbi:MAG: MFS transporter, partial [Bdellovibrionota bacterium]